MTDKILKKALYKLFDLGQTRYEFLSKEDNLNLLSIYFNFLTYPEKEDIFGEAMGRQNILLFETIINVTSGPSRKGYLLVGKKVIHALQSFLDKYLIDVFYEELENYNLNELLNRDNRFRQISEFDQNILFDNLAR